MAHLVGEDVSKGSMQHILRGIFYSIKSYIEEPEHKLVFDFNFGITTVTHDYVNLIIRMYDFENGQTAGFAFSPLQAKVFVSGINKMIQEIEENEGV